MSSAHSDRNRPTNIRGSIGLMEVACPGATSNVLVVFQALISTGGKFPFLHIPGNERSQRILVLSTVRTLTMLELYGLHTERQLVEIGCHGGNWQLASVASSSIEESGEPTSGWKTSRTCKAVELSELISLWLMCHAVDARCRLRVPKERCV